MVCAFPPTPSSVTSQWWLEIGYSGSIYTKDLGKMLQIRAFCLGTFTSLPLPLRRSQNTSRRAPSCPQGFFLNSRGRTASRQWDAQVTEMT